MGEGVAEHVQTSGGDCPVWFYLSTSSRPPFHLLRRGLIMLLYINSPVRTQSFSQRTRSAMCVDGPALDCTACVELSLRWTLNSNSPVRTQSFAQRTRSAICPDGTALGCGA